MAGEHGASQGRQLGPTEVKRLNRTWRRVTQARLCLLLESVSQPFNLGSITRTAAASGAEVDSFPRGAGVGSLTGAGRRATGRAEARRREWAQLEDVRADRLS